MAEQIESKSAAEPFSEPVKIRYAGSMAFVGTGAQWVLTHQQVYGALAARERRTAWQMAILAYIACVVVGVLWADGAPVHPDHNFFFLLLAFILPVLVAMFVVSRRTYWRSYDRQMRSNTALRVTGGSVPRYELTVDATAEGLREEEGDAIYIDRWSAFEEVVAVDDAILVLGGTRYVMLPRAGLGDDATADAFVAKVDQTLLNGGFHRSQRVRALLAKPVPNMPMGTPWRCWKCSYELAPAGFEGALDPRCPECGVRLSEHTLRAGAAVYSPMWRWMLMHISPGGSKRTIQGG